LEEEKSFSIRKIEIKAQKALSVQGEKKKKDKGVLKL